MSVQQSRAPATRHVGAAGATRTVVRVAEGTSAAVRQLTGGMGTALVALLVLLGVVLTAALCLVGVGLLAVPRALGAVRGVADLERERLSRWGPELLDPDPTGRPLTLRAAAADSTTRRELAWLSTHATAGLLLGAAGVVLPLFAVRDLSFPLWYWLVPPNTTSTTSIGLGGMADSWVDALVSFLVGLGWVAAMVGLAPGLARLQERPGRRLLGPDGETDLSLRVAQLTATRAAALNAHAVELRRIERSLHDGTQNRLVAATVLLGAARRAVARDPAAAEELLERAQSAAEHALGELRAVVRSILPPVLADRGLAGALDGLAATCPVPCRLEVDAGVGEGRCAASVEATAYFVVAEALTNTAKHAQAQRVDVTVRRRGERLLVQVVDDGRGGADPAGGSGLAGVRRRAEALDGVLTVTSPPGGPTTVAVELPCGS
ncbi:sensor histidine kinase [Quadrisphaera sp. DSM 44207]|uniref:sensor histidine kinase n=1 Tax=Quadrisphaera sp. DSM 44207 TaxID=1881057 RepID=UPI00087F5DD9|nr:sensor histidine kinase [Quadrisphaera sp. DSM 44207]SDQ06662.1 Histidine kinase-, DNA gyrase B-, and HSP90-like ATPase [Quadrisphaera sp. DSM 44207]